MTSATCKPGILQNEANKLFVMNKTGSRAKHSCEDPCPSLSFGFFEFHLWHWPIAPFGEDVFARRREGCFIPGEDRQGRESESGRSIFVRNPEFAPQLLSPY